MSVKVVCGASNIGVSADLVKQVFSEKPIEDILEIYIQKDKEGNFKAKVAYAQAVTSDEVKAALDAGHVPQILGVDPPSAPAEVVPSDPAPKLEVVKE